MRQRQLRCSATPQLRRQKDCNSLRHRGERLVDSIPVRKFHRKFKWILFQSGVPSSALYNWTTVKWNVKSTVSIGIDSEFTAGLSHLFRWSGIPHPLPSSTGCETLPYHSKRNLETYEPTSLNGNPTQSPTSLTSFLIQFPNQQGKILRVPELYHVQPLCQTPSHERGFTERDARDAKWCR